MLMYSCAVPFPKMQLKLTAPDGQKHIVEVLGSGNQYVVDGMHPKTGRAYEWQTDPTTSPLTPITQSGVVTWFEELRVDLVARGYSVAGEGDGSSAGGSLRSDVDQETLRAPSLARLREAVGLTPNETGWGEYVEMTAAIKAAAGSEFDDDGFAIFAEWAGRWARGVDDPDLLRTHWRGFNAPFALGWDYIARRARAYGFDDAADYFEVDDPDTGVVVDTTPAHIARFNKLYALVETTANVVLSTPLNGGFELMPHQHWLRVVSNDRRVVPVGEGKPPKDVAIAGEWLKHTKRRTVVSLVCDPTLEPLSVVPSKSRAGRTDFNVWPGLALDPSLEGECVLFLAHLLTVVCNGNQDLYQWLLMWLAGMVQQPARLPGTAVTLRGVQGSGKSLIGECMAVILGPGLHVTVDGVHGLVGQFNSRLESKVLLQAEEAFFAGDKKNVGRLKTLITAPTLTIERKNVDAYDVANLTHLVVISNENWVVPAELGERRYVVFDVSPRWAQDWNYFGPLRRQMFEEGGCARLLHYLLYEVTVDWETIARPFATVALRDQQLQSLDVDHRWLHDLLNNAVVPGDAEGEGCALTTTVYGNYFDFMKSRGAGLRASQVALGRLLADLGVTKDRKTEGRKYRYVFPPLAECRATFARGFAVAPGWDEYDEWQSASPMFAFAYTG
jgi:hypothetical protein